MNEENKQYTKEELLEQITKLMTFDESSIYINPDLLQYMEIDELIDIKQNLIKSKKDYSTMLDDIFEKNS